MNFRSLNKKWLLGIPVLLLVAAAFIRWPSPEEEPDLPAIVDFNYHIRPILSQNCLVCHGLDHSTRKADLRLDNFDDATAKLKNGGAPIVPGKAHKSILFDRVSSTDPEYRMPPPEAKKTLSTREIALLKRWIDQGAEYKPQWAFIKPEMPKFPDSLKGAPPEKIIDHLIDNQIEQKQLKPSALANKSSLIRRASYLLTGLPPTVEDLRNYLSDSNSDACEKVIDKYLDSPHFGERWARHWMDLVRYGETLGHEFDFNIGGAWQYRDFLIRAFNQDVPYDLLVKEHIAGDLLANPRYNLEEGFNESALGTGYFFLGEGKHSPVNTKTEEADRIDNVIDITSKTFQALTVSCARCHDHKFDPIPTADYYTMYGMFESTRIVPHPARWTPVQESKIAELKKLKKQIRFELGKQMELASTQPVSAGSIAHLAGFVESLENDAIDEGPSDHFVIGDFRQGSWDGWSSDGWAFGDGPVMGEPIIDPRSGRVKGLRSGLASSRAIATGIPGALRSATFIIEHDSIAVRAAGSNGTIRLIVNNFQIIRDPLYGNLSKVIDDPEFKTYVFDLNLVQGHKAYFEFMPGAYGEISKNDDLNFMSGLEDYIEIEYAVAFNRQIPDFLIADSGDQPDFSDDVARKALADWANNRATEKQLRIVNDWLSQNQGRKIGGSIKELLSSYDSARAQLDSSAYFIGVTDGNALFSPVFIRGSVENLSEETMPRKFLSAIDAGPEVFPQEGSGRLAWAESVADPSNPLTARVMVNRIWHHLFGKGIVETVDNFGVQGKLPTNPQLLDYLALRFMEDNWSIKLLIKHIMLSQTFQRSSELNEENSSIDPQNLYLHHFPVRRLEAEAIRDGILAVSGRLDRTMFGEPVPVHLTEFMTGRGIPPASGPLDGNGRRSVYIAVRRNFLPPMMLAFDMPIPFSTFGSRNTTNVPAQSLALLNDPFVHQQARYWAEKLLEDENISASDGRIREIYLKALSREILPDELTMAKAFLETQAENYGSTLEEMNDNPQLWEDYCHSVINLKEFIHIL